MIVVTRITSTGTNVEQAISTINIMEVTPKRTTETTG